MTKDRHEFLEHELDLDNLKVDSKADADEGKHNSPVLFGHLPGGYKQDINIMMGKLFTKRLAEEESKGKHHCIKLI